MFRKGLRSITRFDCDGPADATGALLQYHAQTCDVTDKLEVGADTEVGNPRGGYVVLFPGHFSHFAA